MSTTLFSDTFTDADGAIGDHIPDVEPPTDPPGGEYSYSLSNSPMGIASNRLVGLSGSGEHTAYIDFPAPFEPTLPYTLAITARSYGVGSYATGVILSGASDSLKILLNDTTHLAVVTNNSEEFDAVVSAAEHTISVYVEASQFTVTIDGVAQTPMAYYEGDFAPASFDRITLTLEYPGSGTSYVDSVSVVEVEAPASPPPTNPDLPSITVPTGAPPFLADGHGIDEDSYYSQVPMATGHSRARRRWTQTARVVTVRWLLEEAQLAAVTTWYEDTLLAGTLEWSARVRKQGAGPEIILWWRARWIDYQTEMIGQGRGVVSGRLLLTGDGSADPPETGALSMEVSVSLLDIRSTVSVPVHLAMEVTIALLQPTELAIEFEVALLMDYFVTGARITEEGTARITEDGDPRTVEY
jgi:hypothetical protein